MQQPVSLRVAVPLIVELHPAQVDVDQDRMKILREHHALRRLGKLEKIAEAGQARQVVVEVLLQHLLPPERPAQRLIQAGAAPLLLIFALVGVPDIGQEGLAIGPDMLADGVDEPLPAVLSVP